MKLGASLRRGYTMVEAIMSLSVLGVGATGVVALQKVTVMSSLSARSLSVGSFVASTWVERLRSDSLRWDPDGVPAFTNTSWISQAMAAEDTWINPVAVAGVGGPASDITGVETAIDNAVFCTQIRAKQLYDGVIRADVRVYFSRIGMRRTCDLTPAQVDADPSQFGFVYVVTGLQAGGAL